MAYITSKEITNLYLYGTKTTPTDKVTDSLIRPKDELASVTIDGQTHMFFKAGRFAYASQFEIVKKFFAEVNSNYINAIPNGSHTAQAIANIFGMTTADDKHIRSLVDQKYFQDDTDDLLERVYIFNNELYKLGDSDMRFVVNGANRSITYMKIKPYIDNFDFNGGAGSTTALNQQIEPLIDPSRIGRRVDIIYDNSTIEARTTAYTRTDFIGENDKFNLTYEQGGIDYGELGIDAGFMLNDFWDDEITKFLDSQDRPIIYGTDKGDLLDETSFLPEQYTFIVPFIPHISDYVSNGVVLIGGKGYDYLYGGEGNDELIAGDPADNDPASVNYEEYEFMMGGDGSDEFVLPENPVGVYWIFDDGASDIIPSLVGSIVAPEEEDGKYVLNNEWNTDGFGGALYIYDGETAQESNTVFILSGFEDGDYGIVYATQEDEGDNEDPAGSGGLPNTPRGKSAGYGVAAAVTEMSLGVKVLTPIALDLNGSGAIQTYSLNDTNNKAFFDMDNDGFCEKTQWLNPVDGWLAMNDNVRLTKIYKHA